MDNKNARAKIADIDRSKVVYVEVGDKADYAGCWLGKDGSLEFMGWIRKFCIKDGDTVVKATKKEIGL